MNEDFFDVTYGDFQRGRVPGNHICKPLPSYLAARSQHANWKQRTCFSRNAISPGCSRAMNTPVLILFLILFFCATTSRALSPAAASIPDVRRIPLLSHRAPGCAQSMISLLLCLPRGVRAFLTPFSMNKEEGRTQAPDVMMSISMPQHPSVYNREYISFVAFQWTSICDCSQRQKQ